MNATASSPAPRKRSFLRLLGWAALILVLLLVGAFFVVTSSGFFKSVVLPRVNQALHAEVTVESASISPFSQVILRQVRVDTRPAGGGAQPGNPLFTASEVVARYSLSDIIGGNIKVTELSLSNPVVEIVQNADGTSNVDPIAKSGKAAEKSAPAKSSAPPKIDIGKIALNNATVRLIKFSKGGGQDLTVISNLNFTVENVRNGQTGRLNIDAGVLADQRPAAPGTNGLLQAKLSGAFTFDLSADLKPTSAKGNATVAVQQAAGGMADLANLSAALVCDVSPTEIRQLSAQLQRGGAALGEVRASGPFDASKMEGRLNLALLAIDRNALNLVGTPQGIDFNATTINSTNQIELAQAGQALQVIGQFNLNRFSVTRTNQTTPTLDLKLDYNVKVDRTKTTALLQSLNLTAVQNGRPLLRADLAQPMTVAWGGAQQATPDSALNLVVSDLNLQDWKPFLGQTLQAGMVNLNTKLRSEQAGRQLAFEVETRVDGLTATVGTNSISGAGISLRTRGQVSELRRIELTEFNVQLAQQNQPALSLASSGTFDRQTQDIDLRAKLELMLPRLDALLTTPGFKATSGALQFDGRLTQKNQTPTQTNNPTLDRTVVGNLRLVDFTGEYGAYRLSHFETAVDCDLAIRNQLLEIRKLAGALRHDNQPGGAFEVSGSYQLADKSGQLALKLADLNQNALRPFLAPSLGNKTLTSVSINAEASARMAPKGETSAKGEVKVSNLLVQDPEGKLAKTPLAVAITLDSSIANQVLDLRQLLVTLTPTARAQNQLQLAGRVDMTKSNAITGNLKLTSAAFDVTPYYDIFAENKPAAQPTAPAGAPAPAPTAKPPATEPQPMTLPFQNFVCDLNIGHLYLREVDVANWTAAIKLDGGEVHVKPFQLTLNGAPVQLNADLNLAVPGYQYDLVLNADKIPLAPLANTFSPAYRGQAQGEMIADARIKGVGTTGASLQKALSGQVAVLLTNAQIQIVGPKAKSFLTPIALVLGAPELLTSPINWLGLRTTMGEGVIQLTQFAVESETFTADTQGQIPIASDLGNSPLQKFPMNFAVRRSIAEKLRLASNTPAEAKYARLPNFVRVGGTLNSPKAELDKGALLGAGLTALTDRVPGLNEKTGGVLKSLGGLLSGDKSAPATTPGPATTTNAPPATAQPKFNPLDLLRKPKP